MVQYLLKIGANLHAVDSSGNNAVMVALNSEHIAVARVLATAGADLTRENRDGHSVSISV